MMSLLQQVDANTSQRLFYPELIPMGPELVLEQQYLERPLPLRRDAMVMASVGPPEGPQSQSHSHAQSRECAGSRPVYAFLLDAGLEVVLYRCAIRPQINLFHTSTLVKLSELLRV